MCVYATLVLSRSGHLIVLLNAEWGSYGYRMSSELDARSYKGALMRLQDRPSLYESKSRS